MIPAAGLPSKNGFLALIVDSYIGKKVFQWGHQGTSDSSFETNPSSYHIWTLLPYMEVQPSILFPRGQPFLPIPNTTLSPTRVEAFSFLKHAFLKRSKFKSSSSCVLILRGGRKRGLCSRGWINDVSPTLPPWTYNSASRGVLMPSRSGLADS